MLVAVKVVDGNTIWWWMLCVKMVGSRCSLRTLRATPLDLKRRLYFVRYALNFSFIHRNTIQWIFPSTNWSLHLFFGSTPVPARFIFFGGSDVPFICPLLYSTFSPSIVSYTPNQGVSIDDLLRFSLLSQILSLLALI